MSGFNLITSNYLEILAERLAEQLKAQPLSFPLAPEVIIVQSQGMARWLSLALADHVGICANYRFPFPNTFIRELFTTDDKEPLQKSIYDNDVVTLKAMNALPGLIERKEFAALRSYLKDDNRGLKLYQLAGRIADTFEQYTVYRPELIYNWENGRDNDWQAILWRTLMADSSRKHLAALAYDFLKNIRLPNFSLVGLPERVTVFGIPSLPPMYIQLFLGLSRFTDIYYYVMNPCREFWADIVSDRESERIARKYKEPIESPEELYLEKGNSLLASMGSLGQEFFDALSQENIQDSQFFQEPGSDSMLASIQTDILTLNERGKNDTPKCSIAGDDHSIQIHSCHSPMREIEVLHDNLLAIFDRDKNLTPRDILVMTPDIEQYAPFIQAVFGTPENPATKIPFSIADRSINRESPVIDAFLELLDIAGSRYEASRVAALLEMPVIHEKFDLTPGNIEMITEWIRDTRIRWGIDKGHREAFGIKDSDRNTWRFGLDRLLTGYAMPGYHEHMHNNILPFDNMEGEQTEVLGKFAAFFDQLAELANLPKQPQTLDRWVSILNDILNTFIISDDSTQRELQIIRNTLSGLEDNGRLAEFGKTIHLEVVKAYLRESFSAFGQGFGFIAGAVTFCAMLPMRSIPFKVICLIGLNHDSFPRQAGHLSFDLIAQSPKPGDRSIRNTDRYLFLETLLSARQKLYISYVGQSIEDNSVIPPSVVVSELLDYIDQGFSADKGEIRDTIVTQHRLQAFSPEYFKSDSRLFSYSSENHKAARTLKDAKIEPAPFILSSLPAPDESFRSLTIDQLCSFFKNPAQYILNTRFDIYLRESDFSLEDRLPYSLSGLDKYELENSLLAKYLEGADLQNAISLAKGEGLLPHGTPGTAVFGSIIGEIAEFAQSIKPYQDQETLPPLNIDCHISPYNISGQIDNIKRNGLVIYRAADVKAKDLLNVWIRHLLINSTNNNGYPRESYYIGKDKSYKFKPADDPEKILNTLLDYYSRGLLAPLKFFPETSLAYITRLNEGKSVNQALNSAEIKWNRSDQSRGESDDLYYRTCFKQVIPLDSEFEQIAGEIFMPLLHSSEPLA